MKRIEIVTHLVAAMLGTAHEPFENNEDAVIYAGELADEILNQDKALKKKEGFKTPTPTLGIRKSFP